MSDSKEELKEKYIELNTLAKHMKKIQKQIQVLEEQASEISEVIDGLAILSKTPAGKDLLVPISPGVFVPASLKDNSRLVVNVGANVAVEKSVEETKELLRNRISDLESGRTELMEALKQLTVEAEKLETEMQKLIEDLNV